MPPERGFDVDGPSLSHDYGEVRKIAHMIQVSDVLLMDAGLIPDTRPPLPKPSRRVRLRWWVRDHLSVYALRSQLAHWIDPDPYKDEPRDY